MSFILILKYFKAKYIFRLPLYSLLSLKIIIDARVTLDRAGNMKPLKFVYEVMKRRLRKFEEKENIITMKILVALYTR